MNQPTALGDIFKAGQAAYEARRYAEAVRNFEILRQHAAPDARILAALADTYCRLHDWTRAVEIGEQAQSLADERAPLPLAITAAALLHGLLMSQGEAAARARYRDLQPRLRRVLEAPVDDKRTGVFLHELATCAAIGNDAHFAHAVLTRHRPDGLGLELPAAILPLMTVEAWSRAANTPRVEAVPPVHTSITGPELTWDYCADGTYLTVIPRGEGIAGVDRAIAPGGIVLEDSGYLALEFGNPAYFPRLALRRLDKVIYLWPETAQEIDADALFLAGTDDMGIGHWIIDMIPRLRFLERAEFRGFKVAIPDTLGPKHRAFLALCGVTDERLIECRYAARMRFRNLLVVQHPAHARATPGVVGYLTQKLRLAPRPAGRRTRIFLDRSMPTRRIVNRAEVLAVLERFGFESLDLAQTSIAEQRERLGAADIVLYTFGSDWLAMLFLHPGADFIEMNASERESGAGTSSALSGINFHLLKCAPADTNQFYRRKGSDFTVGIAALERLLQSICDRKRTSPDAILPVTVTSGPVEGRPLNLLTRTSRGGYSGSQENSASVSGGDGLA